MKSAGAPALKLLISDIQRTEQGFAFQGLAYDRVWLQGTVKQRVGSALRLDDGTGSIQVLVPSQVPDQGLAAGCYALIVGKLKGQGAGIHVNAHKVVNLSLDPGAAASRLMHWNSEVLELQRKVYPLLAQQQQQLEQ